MNRYDQWLTTNPHDTPMPKCKCGHEYEDHETIQIAGDEYWPCSYTHPSIAIGSTNRYKCGCEDYQEDA